MLTSWYANINNVHLCNATNDACEAMSLASFVSALLQRWCTTIVNQVVDPQRLETNESHVTK